MAFDLDTTTLKMVKQFPQHTKLNRLIESIEQQKLLLDRWKNAKSEIQQYVGQKLIPVYQQLTALRFQQLEQLWNSLSQYDFTKAELGYLDEKIYDLVWSLRANHRVSEQQHQLTDQIIQFYQQQKESNQAKHGNRSTGSIAQNSQHSLCDDEAIWDWEQQTEQHQFDYHQAKAQARLKREQDKLAQAEQRMNQSIKTVYLKIASMIHPDREPDEHKKVEKTALLQRANEAYEQQDLFLLLKLQLNVEHLQTHSNKALSQDQLKYYQQALEVQSLELEKQIQVLIDELVWSDKAKIAVKKSKGHLGINKLYKQIDADVSAIKHQLKAEQQRLMYIQQERGLKMLIELQAL